ncbi:DsrE family protein [Guyparkeria sp. GHLCS8-2]|uniref:DsrE family protein n=1 Tax=Guyparkeria halopsychrophila TaxID=3139421 RepID=UPI0037C5440F
MSLVFPLRQAARLLLAISLILPLAAAAAPSSKLALDFTWDDVTGIQNEDEIKVVYGIKKDEWEAGVGKALYYARGLYQSYEALGVKREHVDMHLVLHGAAGYWLLDDEAYRVEEDQLTGNPNAHIVKELIEQGAHVEACYETLKAHGWHKDDLLPGVEVVHDAYSRIIDLQSRGYAYLPFF